MPRRSRTLGLTGVVQVTLAPPRGLAPDHREVWTQLLAGQPPGMHLPADVPALTVLVEVETYRRRLWADLWEARLAADTDPDPEARRAARYLERTLAAELRSQTALAARMMTLCRMTPSSRMDRSMPGRMAAQDAGRAGAAIDGEAEGPGDWRKAMGGGRA